MQRVGIRWLHLLGGMLLPLIVLPYVADSQVAASFIPKFEVASIHQSPSNYQARSFWFTADGVSIKGIPLDGLLRASFFQLHEYGDDRILGEPRWVKSELYDIQARVGNAEIARGKKLPADQQRLALMSLIEERFQMRFHRVPRISSVYVLSLAKGGLKLKPADHLPHMFAPDEPGNLQSHSTFMWQLVDELQNQLGCMVIDETGMNGAYDYALEWTPDDPAHSESTGPSLFTALREQLGLKLQLQKRPVDVVYIDHIERPTPN